MNRAPVPRPRVIIVCGLLIVGMLRASYWQWERHLEKQVIVKTLESRLLETPLPLTELLPLAAAPESLIHRRVIVSGTYDYDHEITIRNKRLESEAGVHVFTPLRITDSGPRLLVNRGFSPLGLHEYPGLNTITRPETANFIGLIKASQTPVFLAPRDPIPAPGQPFITAWLRPNLSALAAQLPYPILPFYVEIMAQVDPTKAGESIVSASNGRDDIMMLKEVTVQELGRTARPKEDYPIPVFDTVAPPARHLGYVYEWAGMALVTLLIGIVLHLKGARRNMAASAGEQ